MLSGRVLSRRVAHRCTAIGLVDTLMALSVAAIILALGVPSMAQWVHAVEVRNSAGDLVAVLQGARTEAVTRNQDVRVTLGDSQGRAIWTLGCATATASCPHRLRGIDAPGAHLTRWGAVVAAAAPPLSAPLPAGQRLPAQVTFNAYGAAPAIASGTEISRIDVSHFADASAHRLVVLLGASGMIRLCDPAIASGRPMSCT